MIKTTLYIIPPERYFEYVLDILKSNIDNKTVIYITTNKPYKYLVNTLEEHGLNHNKFFFIDCISEQLGELIQKDVKNCLFLNSPRDLVSIGIALSQSINNISGEKILFLDSLSILLIYNDASIIGKFSNYLINKMRLLGIRTVILALESDIGKDIIKQVESMSEETITIKQDD